MIKLLEMVLVHRIMPWVEDKISCGQYAHQRARSTEVLLSDLDRFVTGNIQQKYDPFRHTRLATAGRKV